MCCFCVSRLPFLIQQPRTTGPVTNWGDCYDIQYQIDDGGSSMQLKPVILSNNPLQSITYPFASASSVYAADVDGDGDIDVLGARTAFNGSLLWYELVGYPLYGTLESSILDTDTVVSWETVAYGSDEPAGTSVSFQFRSSNDSANMGAWSDTVYASGTSLSGILTDSTDFLQYKAILHSSDISCTPVLDDITLTYSICVSIDENTADAVTCWGFAPGANPSFGDLAVQVSLPQSEMVNLVLHDVTGRVIAQHSQVLPAGTHSVSFSSLAEGVYFCTVYGDGFTATEQVVVLK